MVSWQKWLMDWYGYAKLQKFRRSLGQEFSADNAFEKGKVAMAIDGEWRTAFIRDEAPKLDYGTAPFPVADNRASTVRRGLRHRHDHRHPARAKHAQGRGLGVREVPDDRHPDAGRAGEPDPQRPDHHGGACTPRRT